MTGRAAPDVRVRRRSVDVWTVELGAVAVGEVFQVYPRRRGLASRTEWGAARYVPDYAALDGGPWPIRREAIDALLADHADQVAALGPLP